MLSYTYEIEGDPIALARMRLSTRGIWDPQRQLKFNVGLYLKTLHNNKQPLCGPLHLDITLFMPFPKNMNQRVREKNLLSWHYCKPDLSNMLKFYEDIAEKAGIFKNDSQICSLTAKKVYDHVPRSRFTISEIK